MDLSLFLLKNFLTAKLRKGFKSFCNGVGSTSTLNQQHQVDTTTTTVHEGSVMDSYSPPPHSNSNFSDSYKKDKTSSRQPTLEEMIMQLDLEEKMSMASKSRGKLQEYDGDDDDGLHHVIHHRMSCVNSSDILRSSRNALNQYPRFSLDGRDAMYRSSFGPMKPFMWRHHQVGNRRHLLLPPKIGGHSVVWCKAGVVAKLMGLEAMPVPIPPVKISNSTSTHHHVINKMQNQLSWKRSCERRGSTVMDSKSSSAGYGSTGIQFKRSSIGHGDFGSCSKMDATLPTLLFPKGLQMN